MEYFKLFYILWCKVKSWVKYLVSQLIRPANIAEEYHLKGKTCSWYKIFNVSSSAFLQQCMSKYYLNLKFDWLNRK